MTEPSIVAATCRIVGCTRGVEVLWISLCRSHYESRWRRPVAKARRKTGTIPRTFRGLGIIACRLCGDALRDHDGPCPLRLAQMAEDVVAASLMTRIEVHVRRGRTPASSDPFRANAGRA